MEQVFIEEKTFEKADYTTSPLTKGEYENCTFVKCDFSNADLEEITFFDCEFIGCNLSSAKLIKMVLAEVKFRTAKCWACYMKTAINLDYR